MSEKISIDSNVIGGKPRVEGTRVSVDQIYEIYKIQEISPGKIAGVLTTIDKSEVKEAIEYAKKHDISVGFAPERVVSKS